MSSSPVAAAASDPGGDGEATQELQPEVEVDAAAAAAAAGDGKGSPGPAAAEGDADATMTEAVEEATAVAEVKVEGEAVVAADAPMTATAMAHVVVEEGGAAVTSDPLYATESAGMVSEEGPRDKSFDGMQELDERDGGDEKLEVEAGGLQNEVEAKPVLAGDGAVAGEAVEATDSATAEHAEAESNKVKQNCVNGTPETGVIRRDNEIQNSELSVADESSKIHEDDGASTLAQQDGRSEMHPPIWEKVPDSGNNQTSNDADSPANSDQCARYFLPPLDKSSFRVSDLVWGKVKSHPWWPGEIFDPSDASELALKHQKKGNHLVAYFGDSTFAWCDESQLKSFVTHYSQMEKQSSSDAFVSSVNYALEELSRRILSGMSCSCLPEELSDNGLSYLVENAGLKDGVTCSAVNRSEILTCFSPENLLHYIKSLALFPGQGGDLLELVIACSQLTSFYRSRGCPELASFQTSSAWVDNGTDISSTRNEVVEEAGSNEVQPSNDKPKRGRGRPRKQKPENDLESMDKKATPILSNDTAYDDPAEGHMAMDFDNFDDLQNKKKRSLDSFEDSDTKPSTTTFGSSFKIGECIRRAASQLASSSSIVKSQNEPMVYKNTNETESGEFDISSDDAANELTVEKRAKRRRMHRHHIADPKELLSQLFSVALEPMSGYSFSAMLISYFSDYRNYIVSTTTEASIIEKCTAKRGRKRRVLPSPDVETTDHMQDSYWSGLSLHNHPIHSLRGAGTNMRPRRRRRASHETNVPSVQQLGASAPKKHIQVIERPIIHVDEKMVNECKPTALVLSFGRSAALPSETDLIKMFGRYGPLKESETEVHKKSNTVKVVFKKRADAERAFSAAAKYGTFGPSLRSYRLVNMPFSLGLSEGNNPEKHPEDHGLEVSGSHESEVPLDAMQVDQVNKAEAIKEASAEQVDTVTRTCQSEAADKTLVDQVNMVEKTGQSDTEIPGGPDQIGTDAYSEQAETITKESPEQVGTIEQACTQDEAFLTDRSEITMHGPPDKIGTDAHSEQAETIAEESSEQVGTNEQAYTQDEAFLKDRSEIAMHGRPDKIRTDAHSEQAETIAQESSEQIVTIEQAYAQDEALLNDRSEIALHGRPDQIGTDAPSEQAETIAQESSEQVGTIEQAYAQDEALLNNRSEIALHGRPDQIGTDVPIEQAESIAQESSEQVSTIQQAYTQDEASLKDQSEIALHGAATGALNGDMVDEIQQGRTPNEALAGVLLNTLLVEAVSEAQIEDSTNLVPHADNTNEDLPEVLSDIIQVDVVVEDPKQGHVFGDNAVSEAVYEASIIAQVDTVKQTVEAASDEVPTSPIEAATVPEALQKANVSSDALHFKVQTEEAALEVGVIEQTREEYLEDASKDVMEADTENAAREETSDEVPTSPTQAVTVPESLQEANVSSVALHSKVKTEEDVLVDGVIDQAREESLNHASKDVMETDTENAAQEETSASMELQAQNFTEKTGEYAVEQAMQFQAPKEDPAKISADAKLEGEAVTADAVGQGATENVKVQMEEPTKVLSDVVPAEASKVQGQSETAQYHTVCETSVEQEGTDVKTDAVEDLTKAVAQEAGSNKQTVESETPSMALDQQAGGVDHIQVEAATEASNGVVEAGKQITEDVAMADAVTKHPVMAVGTVESKIEAPIDETVENEAPEPLAWETAQGKMTAEARDEKLENNTTVEVLATETGKGEAIADVPGENQETDNKASTEAVACETTHRQTRAEAPDAGNTMADKIVEDLIVEASDEKTMEGHTIEGPDEESTRIEITIEGTTIEGQDERTTTTEKTIEAATTKAPDERTTTVKETVEGATIEALDEKITTAGKTVQDAMHEAPDEETTTPDKTEDAVTEAPDAKTATVEKTVEGATIEALDEETTTVGKTIQDATVEALDEETTTPDKTEDAVTEAPDAKTATVEKTVEGEALDEETTTAGKTIQDTTVEALDEETTTPDKTEEDAVTEAPDEKTTITEKTVDGATIEALDD